MLLHATTVAPPGPATATPPVVLLGSIASTAHMWLPQVDALVVRGHTVITLDHRGHGHSPRGNHPATMGELARDVLDTLDSLGVDRFHMVGLSLGGAVAQELATTCDRVLSVALLCTASAFPPPEKWHERAALSRTQGIFPLVATILQVWLTEEFRTSHPGTTQLFTDMIAAMDGHGYADCAQALARWDITDSLTAITVPVLTVAGAMDLATPPDTVHAIGAATTGLHTAVTVPGAHVPTWESAAEVTAALVEFLAP